MSTRFFQAVLIAILLGIPDSCPVTAPGSGDSFDARSFLRRRFLFALGANSVLTTHTKSDLFFRLKVSYRDSARALAHLSRIWPSSLQEFIEYAYNYEGGDTTKVHGFFIRFYGDSTYYTSGFYVDGKRDSTWIDNNWSYTSWKSYVRGKKNGVWMTKNKDGRLSSMNRWRMDIPIDTSYIWYSNGMLMEMEVFQNGRRIVRRCYDVSGNEIRCIDE